MDPVTQVQILEDAICFSHCANTLEKAKSLIILSPSSRAD